MFLNKIKPIFKFISFNNLIILFILTFLGLIIEIFSLAILFPVINFITGDGDSKYEKLISLEDLESNPNFGSHEEDLSERRYIKVKNLILAKYYASISNRLIFSHFDYPDFKVDNINKLHKCLKPGTTDDPSDLAELICWEILPIDIPEPPAAPVAAVAEDDPYDDANIKGTQGAISTHVIYFNSKGKIILTFIDDSLGMLWYDDTDKFTFALNGIDNDNKSKYEKLCDVFLHIKNNENLDNEQKQIKAIRQTIKYYLGYSLDRPGSRVTIFRDYANTFILTMKDENSSQEDICLRFINLLEMLSLVNLYKADIFQAYSDNRIGEDISDAMIIGIHKFLFEFQQAIAFLKEIKTDKDFGMKRASTSPDITLEYKWEHMQENLNYENMLSEHIGDPVEYWWEESHAINFYDKDVYIKGCTPDNDNSCEGELAGRSRYLTYDTHKNKLINEYYKGASSFSELKFLSSNFKSNNITKLINCLKSGNIANHSYLSKLICWKFLPIDIPEPLDETLYTYYDLDEDTANNIRAILKHEYLFSFDDTKIDEILGIGSAAPTGGVSDELLSTAAPPAGTGTGTGAAAADAAAGGFDGSGFEYNPGNVGFEGYGGDNEDHNEDHDEGHEDDEGFEDGHEGYESRVEISVGNYAGVDIAHPADEDQVVAEEHDAEDAGDLDTAVGDISVTGLTSGVSDVSVTNDLDTAVGDISVTAPTSGGTTATTDATFDVGLATDVGTFGAAVYVDADADYDYAADAATATYTAGGISVGYSATDAGDAGDAGVTISFGFDAGDLGVDAATFDTSDLGVDAATFDITMSDAGDAGGLATDLGLTTDDAGDTGADATYVGVTYTTGPISLSYSFDGAPSAGTYGDEAETLTTLTYDLGGITLTAKGTDQDDTEVSASFKF